MGNTTPKILYLTVKKQWFDAIAAGEKKNEYRLYKNYWISRLAENVYNEIHFRAGYGKNSPFMRVECLGITVIDDGKNTDLKVDLPVFNIELGRIIEIKNREKE